MMKVLYQALSTIFSTKTKPFPIFVAKTLHSKPSNCCISSEPISNCQMIKNRLLFSLLSRGEIHKLSGIQFKKLKLISIIGNIKIELHFTLLLSKAISKLLIIFLRKGPIQNFLLNQIELLSQKPAILGMFRS